MAALLLFNAPVRVERTYKIRTNQLDSLSEKELINRYRFPRESLKRIIDVVGPVVRRPTLRCHALSAESQVLVTLRYLSKGGLFSEVGDLHGMHSSSVSRCIHNCVDAINDMFDNITFPESENDKRLTMIKFYNIGGFPKVLGAVDGTLIPVKRPIDDEASYICRKGYHALNVQAICDSQLRFLNVVAKWPGCSHDSAMFTNSAIGQHLASGTTDGWILGDSGYPCRPWLLTPLADTNSRNEEKYQRAHLKTRNTIERAFGVLKSRFRCLHKTTGCLQFSPKRCSAIIMACFKLHNFCIDTGVALPPDMLVQADDDHEAYQGAQHADGHELRRRLIENIFH